MNDAIKPDEAKNPEVQHALVPDILKSQSGDVRIVKPSEVKIPEIKSGGSDGSVKKIVTMLAVLACLVFGFGARASTFSITNDTYYTTSVGFYTSNAVQSYTFLALTNLSAGVSNIYTSTGYTGVYTELTNTSSPLYGLAYLTPFLTLSNQAGANLSLIESNYVSLVSIPGAGSNATAGTSSSGSGAVATAGFNISGNAFAALNAGLFTNVISTVGVPNTNQLWVSGAGSNQANGEYVYSIPAFSGGWIYTNVSTTAGTPNGYICAQFNGKGDGTGNNDFDSMPFWMGATTNNWSSAGAPPNGYWYVSMISPVAYWTNNNSVLHAASGVGTGISPMPTVTYGTNFVMQTNGAWLCPSYFAAAFTNGVIYVSQVGNDVLASNLQCAFATCRAARMFAQPGQTIDVLPGTYTDHDLLKNGVNWTFEKGSTISWDDPQSDLNPRGMFDDWAGAVTSTVTGDRMHFTVVEPVEWPAILTTNPATRLTLKFRTADYANYNYGVPNFSQGQYPGAQQIVTGAQNSGVNATSTATLAYIYNCAYVSLAFDTVNGFTNAPRTMLNPGQLGAIGQAVTVANTDGGFLWCQGETHISVASLICTNGAPQAFNSINNGTTETSCFFTADFVNGIMYWSDSNALARCWTKIGLLQGCPAVENGAAALFYGNGYYYYDGLKVVGAFSNPVWGYISNPGTPCHSWATIQKITSNGTGPWIAISTPAITWWNISTYEDNSAAMTTGIQIGSGTNYFEGGYANLTNAPLMQILGGQTTLQGMQIQTSGTNYPIQLFTGAATNNNLTLQNDILHSQTAANSIWTTNVSATVSGTFMADVAPTNVVHLLGTTYYHTQTTQ